MSCDTLRMRGVLLVAASGALLASCETVHIPPEGPTVVAAVAGTPDQLAAFEQAFRPVMSKEAVRCTVSVGGVVSGCEVLESGPVPPSATDLTYGFFGGDTWIFKKLGVAFNQSQRRFPGNLTLTTYPTPPWAVPDCSTLPKPCTTAPWCPQYGGCSKQTYPCAKC